MPVNEPLHGTPHGTSRGSKWPRLTSCKPPANLPDASQPSPWVGQLVHMSSLPPAGVTDRDSATKAARRPHQPDARGRVELRLPIVKKAAQQVTGRDPHDQGEQRRAQRGGHGEWVRCRSRGRLGIPDREV